MNHKPYMLIADVHLHPWSAFASELSNGQNSRLAGLLSELRRSATALLQAGGSDLIVAGDLFHVRGAIAPSVMTPTLDVFQEIKDMGVTVHIVPGNHDLEGKESDRVGNACVALEAAGLATIAHKTTILEHIGVCMVPWHDSVRELKKTITGLSATLRDRKLDLVLHAPINGVIKGLPNHGLDPEFLAQVGARRVFAGHYHNHKAFAGSIYSIGALAHHTWGDIGSVAGFVLVTSDDVKQIPSELPMFVEGTSDDTPESAAAAAKGNFVRVKTESTKTAEYDALRKYLMDDLGARGCVILTVKAATTQRSGAVSASIQSGASVERSVSDFAIATIDPSISHQVAANALRILSLVDNA